MLSLIKKDIQALNKENFIRITKLYFQPFVATYKLIKTLKLLASLDIKISDNSISIQTTKDIILQNNNVIFNTTGNIILQTSVTNNKKIYLNPIERRPINIVDLQDINTHKIQWRTNR